MGQDDCLTEKSGGGLQVRLDLGVLNGYELQTGEVNLACLRVKGLLKVHRNSGENEEANFVALKPGATLEW